jgi:hypothetical protein
VGWKSGSVGVVGVVEVIVFEFCGVVGRGLKRGCRVCGVTSEAFFVGICEYFNFNLICGFILMWECGNDFVAFFAFCVALHKAETDFRHL